MAFELQIRVRFPSGGGANVKNGSPLLSSRLEEFFKARKADIRKSDFPNFVALCLLHFPHFPLLTEGVRLVKTRRL
jgi:hypothetical protein